MSIYDRIYSILREGGEGMMRRRRERRATRRSKQQPIGVHVTSAGKRIVTQRAHGISVGGQVRTNPMGVSMSTRTKGPSRPGTVLTDPGQERQRSPGRGSSGR
jgi:hypothetical protein